MCEKNVEKSILKYQQFKHGSEKKKGIPCLFCKIISGEKNIDNYIDNECIVFDTLPFKFMQKST